MLAEYGQANRAYETHVNCIFVAEASAKFIINKLYVFNRECRDKLSRTLIKDSQEVCYSTFTGVWKIKILKNDTVNLLTRHGNQHQQALVVVGSYVNANQQQILSANPKV